ALRCRLQHNRAITVSEFEYDRIVHLNRMLFAVNADDEIHWSDRLSRRRFRGRNLSFDGLRDVDCARHEIRCDDAPRRRCATQTQAWRIDLSGFLWRERVQLEQTFAAPRRIRIVKCRPTADVRIE